jgi:hypothetical protein
MIRKSGNRFSEKIMLNQNQKGNGHRTRPQWVYFAVATSLRTGSFQFGRT